MHLPLVQCWKKNRIVWKNNRVRETLHIRSPVKLSLLGVCRSNRWTNCSWRTVCFCWKNCFTVLWFERLNRVHPEKSVVITFIEVWMFIYPSDHKLNVLEVVKYVEHRTKHLYRPIAVSVDNIIVVVTRSYFKEFSIIRVGVKTFRPHKKGLGTPLVKIDLKSQRQKELFLIFRQDVVPIPHVKQSVCLEKMEQIILMPQILRNSYYFLGTA